jgi:hypothetical protein
MLHGVAAAAGVGALPQKPGVAAAAGVGAPFQLLSTAFKTA